MNVELKRTYICVDDTDDLTKKTSTGAVADEIASRLLERFESGVNMGITRHQLLLDERVPYTSHNSSMCFDILMPAGSEDEAEEIGWEVIHELRAGTSNPGLCILMTDSSKDYGDVIVFGKRAKEELVQISEAYDLAAAYTEIRLKGEGSTGQGVIGALAGVGLRMTGDDGRFRGKYDLGATAEAMMCTTKHFIKDFRGRYGIEPVLTDRDGRTPMPGDKIVPVKEAKAILRQGRLTFLCDIDESGIWRPYTKDEFNKKRKAKEGCAFFTKDPDAEERFHEKKKRACGSCLYRRLTEDGYTCMAGHEPPDDGSA